MQAQDVAPPPRPQDSGPSLEFTMKYIQDGLNSINGEWRQTPEDGDGHFFIAKYKILASKADPQNGQLSFRNTNISSWGPGTDIQFQLRFRDVSN